MGSGEVLGGFHVMEGDEAACPGQVCVFGADGVVAVADFGSDAFEQFAM